MVETIFSPSCLQPKGFNDPCFVAYESFWPFLGSFLA